MARLAALVLAVAVAAALLASTAGAGGLKGSVSYATFTSTALKGTMRYSVYLPPGYATSTRRYPVIYFLHGLPATSTTYRSIEQLAAAVEASGRQAIVIGV